MQPITTPSELAVFCERLAGAPYITVDTEFLRDKTYFPKLCLLQIAGPDCEAVIDPLAEGMELASVFALMRKAGLVKVFHAARQDIEILYLLSGEMPSPIFDTQIAATVCGYGESVSYETLVNKIVGTDIDKGSRFTDWSQRPLTERQLEYALSDVTHLRQIYLRLKEKIEADNRTSWIEEDHALLTDPRIYNPEPADAWKRLKYGNMRPKNLAVLRELARWREIEARKSNLPRGRILKDESLVELASVMPRKEADLARMRGEGKHMAKSRIQPVLDAVSAALALPASEYPQVPRHKRQPEIAPGALAMLQLLLKVKADAHGITPSIIAGKDDLEALALGQEDIPVLQSWRYDIFGREAQLLLEGKLRLGLNPKNRQAVIEEI